MATGPPPSLGTTAIAPITATVAADATRTPVHAETRRRRPPFSTLALASAALPGSEGGTSGITRSMILNSFIQTSTPSDLCSLVLARLSREATVP